MRAALVALVAVIAGCAGSRPVDISELRRPGAPPAYWLGRSFEGLPLTEVLHPDSPTFVYGTCEPSSDAGCAPPLELQHWPLAKRRPGAFEMAPGQATPCRSVRGARVTAARFATTGGVEVYLGDRVVVLFGAERLIQAALRELRPVKTQQPALPPPPAWVSETLARCR